MYFIEFFKQWMLIFIVLIVTSFSLFSQEKSQKTVSELYSEFDSKYGLDPNLYRGIKYFKPHVYKYGHPFWKYEDYEYGSVVVNNISYDSVLVKYDVYLDNVLFKFIDNYGAVTEIILNKAEVPSFWIKKNEFIRINDPNINREFAQVLYKKNGIKLLFVFSKSYGFSSSSNTKEFGYSKLEAKKYIEIDNQLHRLKNNKNLIKVLPIEMQNEVNKFIKSEGVKIRKASEANLITIFEFINSKL